ncbi:hypothetical protein CBR_g8170 [Chara braunii]|uniref:Myb-like domain-containing protein n=1 Tax=Chara braunii TaxID=69332 RepID=A0A388KLE7_CHABU|nr:hypothetical protein CBR_g8170 [Chara braunii]|eukprot:GBG70870.1 hypothetical protein CBR_g8170 [Chara braunii]
MPDLYRRLPLLLLIVVVFHICFLGRVPGRKQTRRMAKRATKMDKLQTKTTLSVGGGGSSRQCCNSAEGGRRPYDPTLHASTPTYTDLLEGRTPAGYDAGLVNLSFGLRSGSGEGLTHTVLVNPASASKHTSPSVRAAGPADSHGFVSPRRVDLSRASVAVSKTKTVGLAGCRTTTPGGAIDGEGDDDERDATEVVDRQFWDDERQRLRSTSTASIRRGVARISVGAEEEFQDCAGGGGEEIAADDGGDDNDEDEDSEMEIRPIGRKRGGSTARTKVRESRTGQKGKKCGEESSAGDGTKSRDFWTVEHMIALIRAKRDQDSHLDGLGHNYGRMKTKTWKWEDVEKRLVQMGVTRKAKRNSGLGDDGETQKGRGHIPKLKRPRFDDDNSEHSGDSHDEEESMVDAQGADVVKGLGFGRDGVSREQLAVVKQGLLGGVAAGTSGLEKTPSAQKVDTTTGSGRTAVADNTTASGVAEGAGEERVDDVRRDDGRKDARGGADDDDDRPVTAMVKKGVKAIEGALPGAEPPSMLVMPPNDVPRFKIDDPAQREPALRRARNVEKVVLRAIHGWIFKSSSRSTSFARAESYVTLDFATDVARKVWQALEWSRVISPALVYHTLTMKMDVPLWFTGVKIVDRPEDDDMTARQEATVLRLADCWTDVVWCGQWADGGRMKQDRLTRLADCLRVLLIACMWIMRMGGDDDRSHYEASFYASMVAKPRLIAAGSYIFNWRRHIVDSANLVLDRLGKAHLTLGDYMHCIPEWADCGLVFGHNATLKNAAKAAKHGCIGSGPPAPTGG